MRSLLLAAVLALAPACDALPSFGSSVPDPCPEERYGSGEGYDQTARDCLWSAYSANKAATFRTIRTTQKGDPLIYKVTVNAGKVELVYDNTLDSFATERGKQTLQCSRLEKSTEPQSGRIRFLANNCRGGDVKALVF